MAIFASRDASDGSLYRSGSKLAAPATRAKVRLARVAAVFTFFYIALLSAWSAKCGTPAIKVRPIIPPSAELFPLSQVQLDDGPFRNSMELNRHYLLRID